MTVDLPIVLLMAFVAIVVAAMVAQRAGEHADRVAGRRPMAHGRRRGPLAAVADLLDQSVAAYGLRDRLGLSTRTREQRRAQDAQAALVARAEEIRHHRMGVAPARPTHLVVAGRAGGQSRPGAVAQVLRERRAASGQRRSTLPLELVAAVFAFVVVVGVVVAIWPRGATGGVLRATGRPEATAPALSTGTGASSSPAPSSAAP